MAQRYGERERRDEYRGERAYGWRDFGFAQPTGNEVRSWLDDEEAERRRRIDAQERSARERGRNYGPGYEQEWGDYPYRGETWRGVETWGGWGSEPGWSAIPTRYELDHGRLEYRSYPHPRIETYRPPYAVYGLGWGTRPGDFRGRGPKGYQRSDARIHEDVCDRLADAPDIDASDIEVKTTNGEVTLSGSVRDREEKRRAEDLIEIVSGVREVHNNLRISRPQEEMPRTQ